MTLDMIDETLRLLTERKRSYLKLWGWEETCNTPGSYWLWQRDFADIDAKSRERWQRVCESRPPLGMPSEPKPYGVVTATMDTAIRMTASTLDDRSQEEKVSL